MNQQQSQNNVNDSFIYPQRQQGLFLRILHKIDFFAFIPVPKDQPVSTKRSMIGSVVFILLFFAYIIVDFYQFVSDNPPIVQNSQEKLDQQFYTMPRIAIAFMKGQYVNQTGDFDKFMTFQMTKQLKDNSIKSSSPIPLLTNDYGYLKDWLGERTFGFYTNLKSPQQQMKAKGLLYSTQNSNYTKITIRLCNISQQGNDCQNLDNMTLFMAKGRIFLFIQQTQDQSGIGKKSQAPNKFRIANFFLIPHLYKRATIQFQVVRTTVLPDYFHHWTTRQFLRLQTFSITQQSSDTSPTDRQKKRQSIQMLGITFQLAAQVLKVRVVYSTILDHVAKWGAFFNVLFAVFAIIFLAYNKNRFYEKNPDWNRFKQRNNVQTIVYNQDKNHET